MVGGKNFGNTNKETRNKVVMVDLETSLSKITTYKEFSGGFLCRCPFAPKTHPKKCDRSPSLVIYTDSNFFQCYSCGQKGRINELFTQLAVLIPSKIHEDLAFLWGESLWHIRSKLMERPLKEKVYLDEQILEHFPEINQAGTSYLLGRGVDKAAIREYDIRYDPRSNRVVFPVRDYTGKLLGMVGRNIEKKEHFKYFVSTTQVLGGENKLRFDRIAIVEGFIDLLKAWPWATDLGIDIACCWTAQLSHDHVKRLAMLDKYVYLMLDQDGAGNKGAREFAKVYPGLSTRLVWDHKNEKGEVADVGDMTEEQFTSFWRT